MACGHCGKNQAVKTYEEIKNGKKQVEYYCLDCYHRLFLYADETEGDFSLSACPYCGMTLAEVKKGKLVGCANCYKMMSVGTLPMIKKMQGEKAHRGKTPPLEGYDVNVGGAQATAQATSQKTETGCGAFVGASLLPTVSALLFGACALIKKRGDNNSQQNYTKKIFMTQIITMV